MSVRVTLTLGELRLARLIIDAHLYQHQPEAIQILGPATNDFLSGSSLCDKLLAASPLAHETMSATAICSSDTDVRKRHIFTTSDDGIKESRSKSKSPKPAADEIQESN